MPKPLDAATKKQLAARVDYYREMGIYDFYRRDVGQDAPPEVATTPEPAQVADIVPAVATGSRRSAGGGRSLLDTPLPVIQDKPAAL